MIHPLFILIFVILLGLIIGLLICVNKIDKLKERIKILEKDLDKLEDICTCFITQDDLDDFCESLYYNIQKVGQKVKKTIKDEIDSQ